MQHPASGSSPVQHAVEQGRIRLQTAGIDSPGLCAEVLLASVLGLERVQLFLYPDKQVCPRDMARYRKLIERCSLREPVAYLTNTKEFFGRNFYVNKNVLIPRPETEELAEAVMRIEDKNRHLSILDVGTGSGALAVTLGLYFTRSRVLGLDISKAALAVARKNAARYRMNSRVCFCQASLYTLPFAPSSFDCIVTNPPYIAAVEYEQLPETVSEYEPRIALVSGPTGLECYRALSQSVFNVLRTGGYFFAEIGWQQKKDVLASFSHWPQAEVLSDLAGKDRILVARR